MPRGSMGVSAGFTTPYHKGMPGPWALQVSNEFKSWRVEPSLAKNAAPHSGTVVWVRGLRDRITGGDC